MDKQQSIASKTTVQIRSDTRQLIGDVMSRYSKENGDRKITIDTVILMSIKSSPWAQDLIKPTN